MYLRGVTNRWISGRLQHTIGWTTVRRLSTFSQSQTLRSRHDQPKQDQSDSDRSKSNRSGSPGYAPIRPITLFAICIPLAYGLRWAFRRSNETDDGVTSDGFIKYILTSKEDISSTCSIFTLKPATSSSIATEEASLKDTITSVQFKQPQLQICRNYTLLPRTESQDPNELRFLIRRERNGEVSGYLHRLPVGADIEVRGVFPEYKFNPQPSDSAIKMIFLTGGTGIAPAMQAAQKYASLADMQILWASRRREDCMGGVNDSIRSSSSGWNLWSWWSSNPGEAVLQDKGAIVLELDRLKRSASSTIRPQKLLVDYFVDEEGTYIQPNHVQRLLHSDKVHVPENTASVRKILFVSGPDGFINHWAAPKQWKDGHEVQGRLGGVLSTLDLNGWEVIKL